MTATLLFATMAGLLTWRRLAPRVAAVLAMLAAAAIPGWPHDVLSAVAGWLMDMSNWLAATMRIPADASGFPALVAAFIIAIDMSKKGEPGRHTLVAGIFLPFLIPGFPGEIGDGINDALKTTAVQAMSMVGGLIS